ncbi:hypothetical protein NPIL_248251 [Nephila pilipes]|uniref:Uncharacterized protein n=1 Tax=Nephila pilipes TaxID=299642 RepID=A0A8X6PN38_NEPPI|nr:hypothetical protein NPIL_248251 [Nephila pilipes]
MDFFVRNNGQVTKSSRGYNSFLLHTFSLSLLWVISISSTTPQKCVNGRAITWSLQARDKCPRILVAKQLSHVSLSYSPCPSNKGLSQFSIKNSTEKLTGRPDLTIVALDLATGYAEAGRINQQANKRGF